MKRLTIVAALALLATAAAGCAPDTAAPGGENGEVKGPITVLCSFDDEVCQAKVQGFVDDTGIEATFVRMSTGEGVARMEATTTAPEFDAWLGGPAEGHIQAADRGLTEAYKSPEAANVPDNMKDPDGRWTALQFGVLAFCSNPDRLAKIGATAPTSFDDLLDEKFKQEIAVSHPSTSGTGTNMLWTLMLVHDRDEDATFDYLRQLHNNILQYSKSGAAPAQMASRGEIATGIVFSDNCTKLIKTGVKLELTFPKEGTGYSMGSISLVAGAKNPAAAKAFIDWQISVKGQNIGPEVNMFSNPSNVNANVDPDMVDTSKVTLLEFDPMEAAEAMGTLIPRFDSEIAPAPKE